MLAFPLFLLGTMVKKAKSDNVKRHISRASKDAAMELAVADWQAAKAAGTKISFRTLAEKHNVPKSTLERRCNDKGLSISESSANRQKLTPKEEDILVELILASAEAGFPLQKKDVEMFAEAILATRLPADSPEAKVGTNWYFNFCDRHHKRIQALWSSPLDSQRANCLNPANVKEWFEKIKKYVVELGIPPELIFGMDESGFPHGNVAIRRVLGARGTKTQHRQGGADRENVTAIVTICADGTSVRPMIIYKGKQFRNAWFEGNTESA